MLNDVAAATAPAPAPRGTAALTARLTPHTMDTCDGCGEAQGFQVPGLPHLHECPKCATERMRHDLAREQLDAVVAPVLGVWAAYWQQAGLPLEDLEATFANFIGSDMTLQYREEHIHNLLRRVGEEQKSALEIHEVPPARQIIDPYALPLIARRLPNPSPLRHSAFFTAGDKKQVQVLPGLPATVLILEGGMRAVIYPENKIDEGFRCPPELWAEVAAELKYLPEQTN